MSNMIMMIIFSAIFILFVLCMHSSTARPLPAAADDNDYNKSFDGDSALIKVADEHDEVKVVANTRIWKGQRILRASKKRMEINQEEEEMISSSSSSSSEHDHNVIPNNKLSDFDVSEVALLSSRSGDHVLYADYSRPRTRPPSHN